MGKAVRLAVPSLAAVACGILVSLAPAVASAYSGSPTAITGRTNKSGGAGCATCHGAAADATIAVAITGSAQLDPGQAGTYTVTATKSGIADATRMGVAIAASDSPTPLSVVGGMPTVLDATSGEVVHSSGVGALRTTSGNSATYQFTYTMPAGAAAGSTHTLYAVSALGFVGWNHAPNFTVTARPVAPSSASTSGPTASAVTVSWTGGGPNFRVVYKSGAVAPANPTDGTFVDVGAVASASVTGLNASTQYSFRVYSRTAGNVFSSTGAATTATTGAVVTGTRHVNAATGVDAGACTSAGSPCRTITYAMGQATAGNPGDTVSVAPGTYTVALGEVFPIALKSGVALVSTGGAGATVIDGTGDTVQQGLLKSQNNASASTRVEGFTLRFGLHYSQPGYYATGGALQVLYSTANLTVARNVFDRNESRGNFADGTLGQSGQGAWGGAVYTFSAVATIANNIFYGNLARGGSGQSHPGTPVTGNETGGPASGGAVYASDQTVVVNNTFYGNTALGGAGGTGSNGSGSGGGANGGAVQAYGVVRNNIFANNLASSGAGGTPDVSSAGALTAGTPGSVANNLFFANSVNGGASTGDELGSASVAASPQFHDAVAVNLRIGLVSPAKAAGTATGAPATDFDGVTRPNPPSIGAFEASAGPGDSDGDGIPDNVEIAEGRNPLAKDNDLFSPGAGSARLFVMQQYRDFLGREGDAAGIQGWTDLVTAGTYSRPQVIDAFVQSAEFGGFVAPVVRLYFATFLRVPDYAGLVGNAALVRNGTVTLTQLADFFVASPEFAATYGALDNTQFVTLLYGNVLGRAPDQAGLDGWVALLAGGMSRGQVLLGFSDSVEYQATMASEVLVTMMYTAMLRRSPEAAGFGGWVGFLDAATYTREQVINGFFLSTEYRNRFLP